MSEKHFEAKVVKAIRDLGGEVDSFAQRRSGKCSNCGTRLYAGTMQTPGIPDLRAVFPAQRVSVWLEVKWKRNRPSTYQRAWMLREIKAGGYAAPVWTVNDLVYVLGKSGIKVIGGPQRDDVSRGTLEYVDLWEPG